MKTLKVLGLFLAGSIVLASCTKKDDDDSNPNPIQTGNTVILQGEVTSDKTLNAVDTVILRGYVYVKSGATITFQAGTVVKSDITEKGALIIERGAKLMAEGTAAKPIVFTSGKPVGQRLAGDWGGIVILGKATTNRTTEPTIEGGIGKPYGGNDDGDNSGVLKYVRIEYAGIAAQPGSEINGLTCGAVGSGTTLEHIQVSHGNDDAYEFFGGTVNAKYLIAFATADDDFDFDFGYRGKIQYAISFRDPSFVDAGDAGNGVECDNDGTGTAATPFTHPVLSNFTFVGPNGAANTATNHNFANRWRRNTRFELHNSILLGYAKGGFSIESEGTATAYQTGESKFKNNIVHAMTKPFIAGSGATTVFSDSTMRLKAIADGCLVISNSTDIMLTNISSLSSPDFTPATNSPALSGAIFTGLDTYFNVTTFRGAIGATNWTSGWANFNPQNTTY